MASRISLTAVYEPVENGWTQARIEELPGVITAALTLAEAKELLADALREYLLALRECEARLPQERPERVPADRGTVDILIDALYRR
jgi:predicted RNase H-like HicB family nuclease